VKVAPSGFILLRDLRPHDAEELVLADTPLTVGTNASSTAAAPSEAVEEEPQPPQPFEYTS
jgi:26S proteasome regulatory subunit N2